MLTEVLFTKIVQLQSEIHGLKQISQQNQMLVIQEIERQSKMIQAKDTLIN